MTSFLQSDEARLLKNIKHAIHHHDPTVEETLNKKRVSNLELDHIFNDEE